MATKFQEQKSDAGVVSSHGYVVDNGVDEYNLPKGAPPADDPAAAAVDKAAAAASGKDAGTDGQQPPADGQQPPADGQKPQADDQKPVGEQAPQGLDAVLQEIMGLKQALQNPQQPQQQGPDPLVEIETALSTLEEQAKNGDISHEELTMKSIPLIEQRVQINMERKMQADAEAKNVRDAQGAFIAQNPDFLTFAQSPEAAAMINGNPVLDNVSAYYAAKHMQSEAKAQALETELAALKAEMAKTIKVAGKEQAQVVGSDAGTDAQVTRTYRGDGLDPQAGGLAALRRARAN